MTNAKNETVGPDALRRHIFRYDDHMPTTNDPTLIVLKGHLLIEEMLVEAIELALPNPQYLSKARLSFAQQLALVRSISPLNHNHQAWTLMLKFNKLRNDLAHNLEPPKLKELMQNVFAVDRTTQPFANSGIQIDKSQEETMDLYDRLRAAVVTCMQFLISILSDSGLRLAGRGK